MSDPVNTGGEAAPGGEATSTPFAPADAGALGGRVKPAHDKLGVVFSEDIDDRLKSKYGIDPAALNRLLETAGELPAPSGTEFGEQCAPSDDEPDDPFSWDPEANILCRRFGLDPNQVRAFFEKEIHADPFVRYALIGPAKAAYQAPAKVAFESAIPWPVAVTLGELVPALITAIRAHMSISEHGAMLAALWVLHTHALDAFDTSPRLVIRSAHPACGKSRLIQLLSHLVPKPLQLCIASPRALVDSLGFTPTFLIDDAAPLLSNPAIGAVLRNGRQRTTAHLLRSAGKETQRVTIFTAAAVTIHGKTPAPLAGRSIELRLEPRDPADPIQPVAGGHIHALKNLCSMAHRWALENAARLRERHDGWPPGGDDDWVPLRIIAAEAGEEWDRRVRELIARARAESGSPLQLLLADIREIIRSRNAGEITLKDETGACFQDRDRIRSSDLARLLAGLEGQPWNEWGRTASAITPHGLATILAEAEVRPANLRFKLRDQIGYEKSVSERGYMYDHLKAAFDRYLDHPAA